MSPNDATALAAWGKAGAAANPQQLNRYSYVLNNPLKSGDPTGHCIPGPFLVWCAVVVGSIITEVVIPAVVGAAVIAGAAEAGKQLGEAQRAAAEAQDQPTTSGKALAGASKAPEPAVSNPSAEAAKAGATRSPRSNPMEGEPGSTATTYGKDGAVKQVRKYGPDGFPETDIDYDHDHGRGIPHQHDWNRPPDGTDPTHQNRQPGRPLPQ